MKVLTQHHPVEQAIQKIEDILIEHGLSIYYQYGLMVEDSNGEQYRVKNVAGMSGGDSLPRLTEEDKLVVEE